MKYNEIRLSLENQIGSELYSVIEGEILEKLLTEAQTEQIESEWKYLLEGHSFKVTKDLSPRIHELCMEVKERLKFDEEIDFYITNSGDLNAFAISRQDKNHAHIINLNSRTIDLMDDDELKFIIGHEIGHLISNNARIAKLLNFVFPGNRPVPLLLQHKIQFWQKLSELTADRFGYLASPNRNKCISAFFKLSSGLSTERINLDIDNYLKENDKILEFFRTNSENRVSTHPVNPVRIKAIEYFCASDLSDQEKGNPEDPKLAEDMNELLTILATLSSSPLDQYRMELIASGGLMMAHVDGEMDQSEYEGIINTLSSLTIFPYQYLYTYFENDKLNEVFERSVMAIANNNPMERVQILTYLASIAISDKKIEDKEIEFIFFVGEQMLKLSRKEIAQHIAMVIHQNFMPNLG
jgi:Zn-dependent protease with chaperone function